MIPAYDFFYSPSKTAENPHDQVLDYVIYYLTHIAKIEARPHQKYPHKSSIVESPLERMPVFSELSGLPIPGTYPKPRPVIKLDKRMVFPMIRVRNSGKTIQGLSAILRWLRTHSGIQDVGKRTMEWIKITNLQFHANENVAEQQESQSLRGAHCYILFTLFRYLKDVEKQGCQQSAEGYFKHSFNNN